MSLNKTILYLFTFRNSIKPNVPMLIVLFVALQWFAGVLQATPTVAATPDPYEEINARQQELIENRMAVAE